MILSVFLYNSFEGFGTGFVDTKKGFEVVVGFLDGEMSQ